jgi:hypothetical protein
VVSCRQSPSVTGGVHPEEPGGGLGLPSFTGSLFGTAVRMFAEALGGAGSPFASAPSSEAALKQTNGIPEFPRRFTAQEAVSLTADVLLGGSRQGQRQRLTWDLNDPLTGQYLGRLDQQGVGDPSSTIHFHNPQGATAAKATRAWAPESAVAKKGVEDAPLIERGRGQVISLVNTRTNATLGRVVEFAPWSYDSPVTRWLNGLYTSFVVLDDRGEEAALVRRYSVPRLFSYYRGIDTNGQRLVEFKLPLSLVRWKTRWTFERAPTTVDSDSEKAKKKGRLSSLVFPVMAAFHTIDTQQSSLFKRILG